MVIRRVCVIFREIVRKPSSPLTPSVAIHKLWTSAHVSKKIHRESSTPDGQHSRARYMVEAERNIKKKMGKIVSRIRSVDLQINATTSHVYDTHDLRARDSAIL